MVFILGEDNRDEENDQGAHEDEKADEGKDTDDEVHQFFHLFTSQAVFGNNTVEKSHPL